MNAPNKVCIDEEVIEELLEMADEPDMNLDTLCDAIRYWLGPTRRQTKEFAEL